MNEYLLAIKKTNLNFTLLAFH